MGTITSWVKHPVYNMFVHTTYGFVVRADGSCAKTFRQKTTGHIMVVIADKKIKRVTVALPRVIMEAILGRLLLRSEWVQHKDGFKWNFDPNNLFLTDRARFTQRFFVDNQWIRLNNSLSQTAKLLLKETNTKDFDVVGAMFRVSGLEIWKLSKDEVWEYIPDFLSVTNEVLINKINEYERTLLEFNKRDEELQKLMKEGAKEFDPYGIKINSVIAKNQQQ